MDKPDTVSRKALIDWLKDRKSKINQFILENPTHNKDDINGQRSVLADLNWALSEGIFESAESEGEAIRQTNDPAYLEGRMKEYEKLALENAVKLDEAKAENERLRAALLKVPEFFDMEEVEDPFTSIDMHIRDALSPTSNIANTTYKGKLPPSINYNYTSETAVQPIARTLDEWHEDYGAVLWWSYPIEEPPYIGTPLDSDWSGYHTHWTNITIPGIKDGRDADGTP